MPEILRLDGLLVKSEGASYGVDAVPVVGTDGVRLARRLWAQVRLDYTWENSRDNAASGSILPLDPALPRGRRCEIDFFWEAKGAGSDVPPEIAPVLISAGFPETDGASLFDYGPVTSGTKGSATAYAYAGGLLIKVVGCRSRVRWPLVVGESAVFQCTMRGLVLTDPATTALPNITSYDTTDPIAGVNTGLTIGAWTPDWLAGELDLQGVDVEELHSGNALDGIHSYDFGTVDPTFRLTARKVVLATYDPYAAIKARTAQSLVMTFGSAAFNRVKVVSAPMKLRTVTHTDGEGFTNWDLMYRVTSGGVIRFD